MAVLAGGGAVCYASAALAAQAVDVMRRSAKSSSDQANPPPLQWTDAGQALRAQVGDVFMQSQYAAPNLRIVALAPAVSLQSQLMQSRILQVEVTETVFSDGMEVAQALLELATAGVRIGLPPRGTRVRSRFDISAGRVI